MIMEYTLLQCCPHTFRKKKNNKISEITYISLEKQLPISFYGSSAMPVQAQTDLVLSNVQRPRGQTVSQFCIRFPNAILQGLGRSSSHRKYILGHHKSYWTHCALHANKFSSRRSHSDFDVENPF